MADEAGVRGQGSGNETVVELCRWSFVAKSRFWRHNSPVWGVALPHRDGVIEVALTGILSRAPRLLRKSDDKIGDIIRLAANRCQISLAEVPFADGHCACAR
jgi:hypothetical protein